MDGSRDECMAKECMDVCLIKEWKDNERLTYC